MSSVETAQPAQKPTNTPTTTTSLLPLSTSIVSQEVQIRAHRTTKDDDDGRRQASIKPKTVMENFDNVVQKYGNEKALFQKKIDANGQVASEWTSWTWKEYRTNVDRFAKALLSLGFNRFDCINIIGFNAPEWFFANYGTIAAGGVPAGIYTTNNADACYYISSHSNARVVVCDSIKQLEKYYNNPMGTRLPNLQALVLYGTDTIPANIHELCSVPVHTFDHFLTLGDGIPKDTLRARSTSWKPGETCTLIYTSGTTGPPKAVMITNDNITWTVETMFTVTKNGTMTPSDSMISYLPLSHIAAQMLDMHMPVRSGCRIYFAQPDALKGSLGTTLKDVRPTTFFGVPRVWEKIYDKLQEVAKTSTGLKKKLSTWAKSKASAHWKSLEYGSRTSSPMTFFLAKKLLHKAHIALGFDRCYAFYVSAAPIETKIIQYFMSLNIPIMELFGQSECTGPHAVNTYSAFKVGTVGRPLLGTETKIDPVSGELCYRGRHIFAGYMGMVDQTKATIDRDGWLHSGDIVSIDADHDPRIPQPSGFLSITGRIKELIITAGGENIPPVLIEEQIKLALPCVSNVMVIGDKRKYLTALLCLHVEIDTVGNGSASTKLTGEALATSKQIGSTALTTTDAKACTKWMEYIERGIQVANTKATSNAQRIQKWSILDTDFTEYGGELTPTLKLKRSVAAQIHSKIIEEMYQQE